MEAASRSINIIKFTNAAAQIIFIPSKHRVKAPVLQYLAGKFELGRDYSEKEINAVLTQWHTFPESDSLRRMLIDEGLLGRTLDGSRYWRNEAPENWIIR